MPEIWTIALTSEGIGACAMTPDMNCRKFTASWPKGDENGVCTVDVAVIRRFLAKALGTLQAESPTSECPLAIGLCAHDEETAVFVDRFGDCQSPVYWDAPLTMSKRAIPEKYAVQELASVYRNSVLRCLQQQKPLFGDHQTLGLWSVGALAAYVLTGHCFSSVRPRGVPVRFPVFEPENRERMYAALGVHPDYSMKPAKCGHVFARISPEIVGHLASWDMPQLASLTGVPVFDLGASQSALAYACGANPLSWAAHVGWQTSVYWTASITALAEFEIQVVDHVEEASKPAENASDEVAKRPEELSADDWTALWCRHLEMEIHTGPRKSLASYGVKLPTLSRLFLQNSLASAHDGVAFDLLKQAPLGSSGLHVWQDIQGWHCTGLQAGHRPAHLARACFEGQIYAIRQLREALGYQVCGPLRLFLSAPWPVECAQWAADILNAPVIWIEGTSQTWAAFGAGIALLRDLDIPHEKPKLEALILEPQERAAHYATHYQIHRQLHA